MKKKIIGLGILALIIGVSALSIKHFKGSAAKLEYQQFTVDRGSIRAIVSATGSVTPENRLEIKPPIAGRIEDVLVREGDLVKKGQTLAWMSSTERAALIDAARSKGDGNLAYWEGLYKPSPIIAPLGGLIIARNVEPGQTFTAQDAVFVMSNRLIIKAQVDETDLAKIALGQSVDIVLDAYADRVIAGKVTHIAYEAQTVNNVTVYQIEILPVQIPNFMRSGMSATVRFVVAQHDDALRLPLSVIQQRRKHYGVLVADVRDKTGARFVNVDTGIDDGQNVEILSGLNENDTVLQPKFDWKTQKKSTNPLVPQRKRAK